MKNHSNALFCLMEKALKCNPHDSALHLKDQLLTQKDVFTQNYESINQMYL